MTDTVAPTDLPASLARSSAAIAEARAHADPAVLPPGTRAAIFKRLILRLLRVYTFFQTLFNRSVLAATESIQESVSEVARSAGDGLSSLSRRLEDRIALLETRGTDVDEEVESLHSAAMTGDDRLAGLQRDIEKLVEEVSALRERVISLDHTEKVGALFPPGGYQEFERRFRGSRETIRARQAHYLPILRQASAAVRTGSVIDLGCGSGELLEVAQDAGLRARGFDQDSSMVASCRSRGLDANEGDLFEALERQADGSAAGVTAIQVIEHLDWPDIRRLTELAHRKLAAGGVLILETVNPSCLYALRNFHVDPTHRVPIPEPTCRFFVELAGFDAPASEFLRPVEETWIAPLLAEPKLRPLVDQLFGGQDYAVIGWKRR